MYYDLPNFRFLYYSYTVFSHILVYISPVHFYNFKAVEIEKNNNKISNIIFNCTIAVVSVSILTFISLITIGVKVTN